MKPRVRMDTMLVVFAVLFTGVLVRFPQGYLTNPVLDNILDFLGLFSILEGTMLRMLARGHKRAHSSQSRSLVTTGPYVLTRNPMYLGSFLIGVGFLLIVWPWWTLPIFTGLFYTRFNKQMVKEEALLTQIFGEEYENYCEDVPRLFPAFGKADKIDLHELMNKEELFSTKEKRGLLIWPLLAFILELFQERMVLGSVDLQKTIVVFLSAIIVYAIGFIVVYKTVETN